MKFSHSQAAKSTNSYKKVAKEAEKMYNTGSEASNIDAYLRDLPLRRQIQSASTPKYINVGQQNKHIQGTHEYKQYEEKLKKVGQYGPSYVTMDNAQLEKIVQKYSGTGILNRDKNNKWTSSETITVCPDDIGVCVNNLNGVNAVTSVFIIKYGNNGVHVIPTYPSKKGAKATK